MTSSVDDNIGTKKTIDTHKIIRNVSRETGCDLAACNEKLPKPLDSTCYDIWSNRLPKGHIYTLEDERKKCEGGGGVAGFLSIESNKSIKPWSCFHFICY
tara:strand:- start:1535 stop:1834 length:300 start_codon:yes stop_codon:yes gene_type:complete